MLDSSIVDKLKVRGADFQWNYPTQTASVPATDVESFFECGAILDREVRLRPVTSISETWGTQPEERELAFPCDNMIPQPDDKLYRGVTVNASAATLFRWLCQMRVAPYSYDWLDNGGQQSPRELTPGLDDLEVGQDVMRIFTLVDFERDRHLTLRLKPGSSAAKTFGDLAVSYVVVPMAGTGSPPVPFVSEVNRQTPTRNLWEVHAGRVAMGRFSNDAASVIESETIGGDD